MIYGIYDTRLGPRISQAGMTNGEMWVRQGFTSSIMPYIKYYEMISNTQYNLRKNPWGQ